MTRLLIVAVLVGTVACDWLAQAVIVEPFRVVRNWTAA